MLFLTFVKPIQLANILAILKHGGGEYGNRRTFPLFLTTFLNFLFLLIVGRNFEPVYFFYIFLYFNYGILISLLLKHH